MDSVISHDGYQKVINEKQKNEKVKENIREMKSDDELSGNKNIRKNVENI